MVLSIKWPSRGHFLQYKLLTFYELYRVQVENRLFAAQGNAN